MVENTTFHAPLRHEGKTKKFRPMALLWVFIVFGTAWITTFKRSHNIPEELSTGYEICEDTADVDAQKDINIPLFNQLRCRPPTSQTVLGYILRDAQLLKPWEPIAARSKLVSRRICGRQMTIHRLRRGSIPLPSLNNKSTTCFQVESLTCDEFENEFSVGTCCAPDP